MADRTTTIKVTADASGFVAALEKAENRLDKYGGTVAQAKARQEAFQRAIEESGATTAKQVNAIASAVAQMDRMAATAGKTKAELAAMRAESLGITNAMSGHVKAIADASKETDHFNLATNGARRELMVLAHELSQGNFQKFGGSLMVLGERTGGLSKIFNKTALSIAAFVAVNALAIEKTVHAAEMLAEYGETVERVARVTGMNTDAVQQWTYAANTVGVSAKESAKALEEISQAQNKALHENKDAAAAFAAVGISMQQLKAQSPQETLYKVADAFAASADGAAKAAVAHEVFGAEGDKLIPLLNKGSEALRALGNDAQAAGAVLDQNLVVHLAALDERLKTAKARMEAASLSAKAQLAPAIMAVTEAMSGNASMRPLIEDFYKGVLTTFRAVTTAAATVVVGFEQMGHGLGALAAAAGLAAQGEFSAAQAAIANGYADIKKMGTDYVAFTQKLWSDAAMPPVPGEDHNAHKRELNFAKGNNGTKKADESELNGQLAELQTLIKRLDTTRKESLETTKADLDRGLISYEQYFANVAAINNDAFSKEADLARKRLELAQQKRQIAAAQTAQQELDRIQHEGVQAALRASDTYIREHERRQKDFEKFQTARAKAVANQARSYDVALHTPFMSRDAAQDYQTRLKLRENYEQQIQAIRDQYPNEGDEAERARRVAVVQKTYEDELAAYQQYEAQRRAVRESYADQMKLSVNRIVGDGNTAAETLGQGFTSVYNHMTNGLEQFVTSGKLNFKSFTASILADLAKIAAQQATMQLFGSAMGLMGLGGAAAGTAFNGASSVAGSFGGSQLTGVFLADGGPVVGPGTGQSDSVPAHLSNGEFVVNAAATGKYRSLLEAINSGQVAHFATGGYVGTDDTRAGTASSTTPVSVTVNHGKGSEGLSEKDAKELHSVVQAFVDKRMSQNMRGQGGYAYQMKYGQI